MNLADMARKPSVLRFGQKIFEKFSRRRRENKTPLE
jgi:hypothetical protein